MSWPLSIDCRSRHPWHRMADSGLAAMEWSAEKGGRSLSRVRDVCCFIGGLYGPELRVKRVDSLSGAALGMMEGASLVSMIDQALAQGRGLATKHAVRHGAVIHPHRRAHAARPPAAGQRICHCTADAAAPGRRKPGYGPAAQVQYQQGPKPLAVPTGMHALRADPQPATTPARTVSTDTGKNKGVVGRTEFGSGNRSEVSPSSHSTGRLAWAGC